MRDTWIYTTHFFSANLSLLNLPPFNGKFVLKTPFLEAGVPASIDTRRMYGVYAGGKRMY